MVCVGNAHLLYRCWKNVNLIERFLDIVLRTLLVLAVWATTSSFHGVVWSPPFLKTKVRHELRQPVIAEFWLKDLPLCMGFSMRVCWK